MNKLEQTDSQIQQFATEAEVIVAIDSEAKNPSPRIAAAAKWILNRHPSFRVHTSEFDLIYSAYEAILTVRNWNKAKVDFSTYVVGVMRSIASNETRKLIKTKPNVIYGQVDREDDDSTSVTVSEEILTPEEIMMQSEVTVEVGKRIETLRSKLHDDSIALTILNMLLEHGLSKAEIRKELELNDLQFWAADRRLQRAIEKLGDNEK